MKETQSAASALEEPFSQSSRLGGREGGGRRCSSSLYRGGIPEPLANISPSGTKNLWGLFFLFINTKGIVELRCHSHYCGLHANSCSCSWAFSCFLFLFQCFLQTGRTQEGKNVKVLSQKLKNPKESKELARLGVLPKPFYSLVNRLTWSSFDGLLQRSLEGH